MNLVTIRMIIDVAGALEAGAPEGSLFMFDNRRLAGSRFQSTNRLHTAVSPGDRIVWLLSPIECEVYVALERIDMPGDFCEISQQTYEGTNIVYWAGTVKKPVGELPYDITFRVGTPENKMTTNRTARLIDAIQNGPHG